MHLIWVGGVATASAAVPPLASTASATDGPSHFRATDPPGHRHSRRCGGLRLPRYDAVDPPAAGGRRTTDQTASLVLDEAPDVLECSGCQVDGVVLSPDTQPSGACFGSQFLSSSESRHRVEGVER